MSNLSANASNVQATVLDNGLQILTREQHDRPIVSVMLWYRVGSRHEVTGKTGVAHFLEHLLFKGTDIYQKGDIDRITALNGGSNNAFTWIDATAYYFSFASDRWEAALEIEANRMRHNAFVSEEIEAEREVVLSEWRSAKDSPEENLYDLVNSTALTAHPYRNPILGWFQDISHINREEIVDFYHTYYHPNNATLVIVGDFNTKKTLAQIQTLFGHIPPVPEIPTVRVEEPTQEGEKRLILKKKDAKIPKIQISYKVPNIESSDFYPLIVMDNILTNGLSSLLYQSLVESARLANDISSYFFATHSPYLLTITAEARSGQKLPKLEQAIDKELDALKLGKLNDRQVQKAINQIVAEHYFEQETYENQAMFLGEIASITDWKQALKYVERIQAVTLTDVIRVAQTYLNTDQRTVGWLVPLQEEKQVHHLGHPKAEHKPLVKAYLPRPVTFRSPEHITLTVPHFQPPKEARRVLKNGMTLIVSENHANPTVRINAFVKAGTLVEPSDKAGLANLTADLLLKGTQKWSAVELAEQIEFVGGQLSSDCGTVGSGVDITVLTRDLPLAQDILEQVLRYPTFPAIEVEKEKDAALDALLSKEEDPRYLAYQAFKQFIYQKHPASRAIEGQKETLQTLKKRDFQKFHKDYYTPDRTIIAISGDVDAQVLLNQLEKRFQNWQGKAALEPELPILAKQTEKKETHLVIPDKEQVNIFLGHLGVQRNHPDFYALLVMDTILGGGPGFTSRIPAHLRDEQGLAYTTYSTITASANLYPGLFVAYMGTKPENLEKGVSGLLTEIDLLREKGVSQEELLNAQAYLTGNFVFDFETNAEITDYLIEREVYQLPDDFISSYPERIQAITPADVQRVACQYLDTNHYTLVVTGPDR